MWRSAANIEDEGEPKVDDEGVGPKVNDEGGPKVDNKSGPKFDDEGKPKVDDEDGGLKVDDEGGPKVVPNESGDVPCRQQHSRGECLLSASDPTNLLLPLHLH